MVSTVIANKTSSEGVERMLGEFDRLGATVDGHSSELTILEAQAEEFKEDLDALATKVATSLLPLVLRLRSLELISFAELSATI